MPARIETMPVDDRGRVRLSKRQVEMLAAIRRLTAERGYAPTIRELASEVGVTTTNSVAQTLQMLRRKGWVTWEPMHSRTLRVND